MRDALRMTRGIGVLRVDGGRQRADGAEKHLLVFFRRSAEPLDEAPDLENHEVERLGKLTDLVAARDYDVLREISRSETARAFGQLRDGPRKPSGKHHDKNPAEHRREHRGDDTAEHDDVNVRKDRLFFRLNDGAPAEISQKRDRGVAIADRRIGTEHGARFTATGELEVHGAARKSSGLLKGLHDRRLRNVDHAFEERDRIPMGDELAVDVDHVDAAAVVSLLFHDLVNGFQADRGCNDADDDGLALAAARDAHRGGDDHDCVWERL